MTAYSLYYNVGEEQDYYALDWNWQKERKWTISTKGYCSNKWENLGELDEIAYKTLLEHFGLEKRENEFSIDKIAKMSPLELAKIGGKNPLSYTIGDHRKASEVR